MRIGDAVQLGVNRLQGNKLLLHTEKTGVHVYCVLPDIVTKAHDAAPHSSQNYFFWTGKSKVRSAKGKWERRLQRLFEFASVVGGHAHRFRDTFAVELLLANENVSGAVTITIMLLCELRLQHATDEQRKEGH